MRGLCFSLSGHPVDKVELVIMGGTFPTTPKEYQTRFCSMLPRRHSTRRGIKIRQKDSITFERFEKALAEYFEDYTVGYQEHPTEQDLKDLHKDFLEYGKTFD